MKNYLFIVFCLANINTMAQNAPVDMLKKMTPVSPTAASLGVYGDIPVSLYTGVPDISIPIYEIHVGDFNFPISLSYHASGIKVDEVASSVGMGWALNAGGVVSRNQRGIQDEAMIDGFVSSAVQNNIATVLDETKSTEERLAAISSFNQYDTESDIFFFAFPGGSGKFFLDPSGNYYFMPVKSKFKIDFLNEGRISATPSRSFFARFIVTDNNGVKYVYGKTLDGVRTDAYEETCTDGILGYECEFNIGVNSWFLNEIILANDQRIKINYEVINYQIQNTLSTSLYFGQDPSNVQSECGISKSTTAGTLNYSRAMRIRQIIFPNGKIEFTPGEVRNDLAGDKTLGSIDIYSINKDSNYEIEKSFQLTYTNGQRLFLNGLVETSPEGNDSKKYSFSYNTFPLPSRGSTAQDMWGYYNGQSNNFDLVPTLLQPNSAGGFAVAVSGSNRAVDPRFTQAGILKSITYPTGGSSEFEFENNTVTCQDVAGTDLCSILDATAQYPIDMGGGNFQFFQKATEEVSPEFIMLPYYNSYFKIQTYSQTPCVYDPSVGLWSCASVDLEKKNDDGSFTTAASGIHDNNTYSGNFSGTYRIKLKWASGYNVGFFGVALSFPQEYKSPQLNIAKGERFGGGLRIKTIKNFDPLTNKAITRSFNYDYNDNDGANRSGETSGVLMNVPVNFYLKTRCAATSNGPWVCAQNVLSSNSQSNLLSHDGVNVGYKKVEEFIQNGEVGMKEYYFTTALDYPDDGVLESTSYPFPQATSYEWRRGLTSSSVVRKDDGGELKSTNQFYTFGNPAIDPLNCKRIPCVKITQLPVEVLNNCATFNSYSIYYLATESFYLSSQVDTDYSSVASVIKNTSYVQDPKSIETQTSSTIDSKGRLVKTYYRYPVNFDNVSLASSNDALGIKKLLDFNMLKIPVEKIVTITGSDNVEMIVSATLTTFFPDKPVPAKIYDLQIDKPTPFDATHFIQAFIDTKGAFIKDSRYKEMVTYKAYDVLFNPIEFNKVNDVTNSFVWGYNNAFVIAQIKNASASQVFYTGFEEISGGGNSAEDDCKTGKYSKTDGYTKVLTGLAPNTNYLLTYWQKANNAWTLQSQLISLNASTTSYTISLTGQVDDVRFLPQGAQMITYTYEPIIGVTSITDANGKSSYYEYDEFGRLQLVRDSDGNIVKRFSYQYKLD